MTTIRIRRLKCSDAGEAGALIARTYRTFNRHDATRKGLAGFLRHYDPSNGLESIREHLLRTPLRYVAVHNDKIVGVIRGFERYIVNLYVHGDYHRMGVGSQLLARYLYCCRRKGVRDIKLRATSYGVPFYQKHGFKRTTGVRMFWGLRIQPMKKML